MKYDHIEQCRHIVLMKGVPKVKLVQQENHRRTTTSAGISIIHSCTSFALVVSLLILYKLLHYLSLVINL